MLARKKASVRETVDAKKKKIGPAEAVRLARRANQIWIAKGKKIVSFDLKKGDVSDAELKKGMIGPSGNLRAPTLQKGKQIFVGFHADELPKFLS